MIQVLVAIWQNDNHSLSNERIMTGLKVLAVLDNGLVHLRALVGEEVDFALVHLRALVGKEVYQLVEDPDHALQHGGPSGGATWRPRLAPLWMASGHACVVFDMTRQSL